MSREPGARDPRELSSEDAVDVALVPAELVIPRIRRVVAVGIVAASLVGVVVGLFTWMVVGLVVFVALAAPGALALLLAHRRTLTLDHRVISKRVLGTTRVNILAAEHVSLTAQVSGQGAGMALVTLEVGHNGTLVKVPVAAYQGAGAARGAATRGRELRVLGTRRLAEALRASNDPHANAVGEVFMAQLRAQARDRALPDRPFFRATQIATEVGGRGAVHLDDGELEEIALE